MIEKLLYEVAEILIGSRGMEVVDLLIDKRDVNEFKIAKKLKLTINQARNLLYKLYATDVVSFIRKKDKAKGWYIYYWTLNKLKALELLAKTKEKEIQQHEFLLKSRENKQFYICNGCNIELTADNALNHNFICQECGKLLELHDDREKIEEVERVIGKKKKELSILRGEIGAINAENQKKRDRKMLKDVKKKAKMRKEARVKNKKNKEKGEGR